MKLHRLMVVFVWMCFFLPLETSFSSEFLYDGRYSEDPRFRAMTEKVAPLRQGAVETINERLGLRYVDRGTILVRFRDAHNPDKNIVKKYRVNYASRTGGCCGRK